MVSFAPFLQKLVSLETYLSIFMSVLVSPPLIMGTTLHTHHSLGTWCPRLVESVKFDTIFVTT